MINADTPASPITNDSGGALDLTDGTMDDGYFSQEGRVFSIGLTKRERFAAMAMQWLIANNKVIEFGDMHVTSNVSKASVQFADALLKELSK